MVSLDGTYNRRNDQGVTASSDHDLVRGFVDNIRFSVGMFCANDHVKDSSEIVPDRDVARVTYARVPNIIHKFFTVVKQMIIYRKVLIPIPLCKV